MNLRLILGLIILLAVVIGSIFLIQNALRGVQLPFGRQATATINNQKFKLQVAKSPKDKQVGLSGKSSLAQDNGMLFPFEQPDYYSFWMKNMKFPIDIIFIRGDKIVTIYDNVQPAASGEENPPVYQPEDPADKVLEINAGLSKKHNLKKGDRVKIEGKI